MKSRKLYVISVFLLVIGVGLFITGFGMMDFNFKNFDSEPPYIERVFTPIRNINEINIDLSEANINFTVSADNKLHIRYYENINEQYSVSEIDGRINLTKKDTSKFLSNFLTLSQSNPALVIELPKKYDGSVSVKNTDGKLNMSDVTLKKLTTDVKNGNIRLSNMKISGQCDVQCDGGEIRVYDIEVKNNCKLLLKNGELFAWSIKTKKLYSTTENGLMTLAYINSESIFAESDKKDIKISCLSFENDAHLLSQSGNITGTVMGHEEDFTFFCSAPEGSCNLADNPSQGNKNLHITTDKGNIDVSLNAPTE